MSSGLRPEEAVNLRKDNIALPSLVRNDATGQWEEPAGDWGELRFCFSRNKNWGRMDRRR